MGSARRLRMRSTSKRSARIVLSKCLPRPATRPTSMRSAVLSLSSASSTLPTPQRKHRCKRLRNSPLPLKERSTMPESRASRSSRKTKRTTSRALEARRERRTRRPPLRLEMLLQRRLESTAPPAVMEDCASMGIEPPMSPAEIPEVREKVKAKLEFWKSDQEAQTKKNIAKAQKEVSVSRLRKLQHPDLARLFPHLTPTERPRLLLPLMRVDQLPTRLPLCRELSQMLLPI